MSNSFPSQALLIVFLLAGCGDDATSSYGGGTAQAGAGAGGSSPSGGGASQAGGGAGQAQGPSCDALCPAFASCAAGAMAICLEACAQATAACRTCVSSKSCNAITQCDAACGGSFLSPKAGGGGANGGSGGSGGEGKAGGAGVGQASDFFSACTPGAAGACLGSYDTCVPFGAKAYCTKECFVNTDCDSVTSQECQQQPSGLQYCVPQGG